MSTHSLRFGVVLAVSFIIAPMGLATAPAQAANNFGCFQVVTPSLNIRARPYSDAKVIGTASAGDVLEKRKPLCTLRGYWCAVRKGTVEGYADKSFLGTTKCP
jgi:hypothetical protein